ncbi:MAG: squalene/phytoene synthase family protein [Gemmatimonadota bacterium]|jgi:farnesyl-diphosphate farnesyltransferase
MPTLNELLHAASRTFAIGIDLLPEPLRSEIEVAYLLLRVSDYLEDNEEMPAARKAELLGRWASVVEGDAPVDALAPELEAAGEDTPDALVARHVGQVHDGFRELRPEARGIVSRHVADSTRGMARWAVRGPDIEHEADLDDYMHEVAGRVGWLLTELFAVDIPPLNRDREEMMRLGREFGLALQTVNVVRGLHTDWERGWVYIPRSFLPADGPEPGELFDGDAVGEGRRRRIELAVLDRLVEKSDRHLAAARRYIAHIPRRHHGIRLFCLLPLLFAVRTLAVSRDNPRVFDEETKIGRDEVRRIVRDARLFGFSNRWIAWYCERLEAR